MRFTGAPRYGPQIREQPAPRSVRFRSGRLRERDARGQLQDPDVAKVDLRSFGFQTEVAFPACRAADAVDELAVDGELDDSVDGHDVVGVPFAPPLAAVLDRHAPLAAGVVGHDLHAADTEELAVH